MTRRRQLANRAWIGLATLLVALAWWRIERSDPNPVLIESRPVAIMGTDSMIAAFVGSASSTEPLQAAEAELRRLEVLFSGWIDASEISALNRASSGVPIALSRDVLEVLSAARELHEASGGVFDVTSGPLIERWRQAGEEGVVPTAEDLAQARQASSWSDFELGAAGATKSRASARVDLDGLAKGHAIDLALEALLRAGAVGGVVEVGGDLRVAGSGPDGLGWRIGLRSPYRDLAWGDLLLNDLAICTSGPYHRSVEIDGKSYSHIVDPRSLQPANAAVSTTVIAPDARTADAWATVLAVLGEAGLESLPHELDALVVSGQASETRVVATQGFLDQLVERDFDVVIFDR